MFEEAFWKILIFKKKKTPLLFGRLPSPNLGVPSDSIGYFFELFFNNPSESMISMIN